MTRPKRTRKDANHRPVVDELREAGYIVIETADLPGHPEHNPLDFFAGPMDAPVIAATDARQVARTIEAAGGWVQVELKPDFSATFTEKEEAYLRRLDRWPPEFDLSNVESVTPNALQTTLPADCYAGILELVEQAHTENWPFNLLISRIEECDGIRHTEGGT